MKQFSKKISCVATIAQLVLPSPRVEADVSRALTTNTTIHQNGQRTLGAAPHDFIRQKPQDTFGPDLHSLKQPKLSPSSFSKKTQDTFGFFAALLQLPTIIYLHTMRREHQEKKPSASKFAWGIFCANDILYALAQSTNNAGAGAMLQKAWSVISGTTLLGALKWGVTVRLGIPEVLAGGGTIVGLGSLALLKWGP